jgi:hypothetical protein
MKGKEEKDKPQVYESEYDLAGKETDISRLLRNVRGNVIEGAIQIDAYMNILLAEYFISDKDKRAEFLWDFLFDEGCTTGFKIGVINRIGLLKDSYDGMKKDLQRLYEIRNLLAHSLPQIGEEVHVFRPGRKKKKDQKKTVMELNEEFNEIHNKVIHEFARLVDMEPL